MIRICTSLQENGYRVKLIGFRKKKSKELFVRKFDQKRLSLWFEKGKFFYLEVQIRLFFYLLLRGEKLICSVDMDTILPTFIVSRLKNKTLIFDAHEYYSETSGLYNRSFEKSIWKILEKILIPRIKYAYTVNQSLADIFKETYNTNFEVIRNLPLIFNSKKIEKGDFFIYQGALNKGRGLEELLHATKKTGIKLKIAGDGPLKKEIIQFIESNNLKSQIEYLGMLPYEKMYDYSSRAICGLNLIQSGGISYYYSLANKFFDYMQSGTAQICMDFPEYKRINDKYDIAYLISDFDELENALIELNNNESLRNKFEVNSIKAAQELNWENESKLLIKFYDRFASSK